jgi:outer membrane protein assembly factor BamB
MGLRDYVAGTAKWTARLAVLVAVVASAQADILVSSFFDNEVVVLDEETGALLGDFTSGPGPLGPEGLLIASNGNLLVVAREGGTVREYDGITGEIVGIFATGLEFPHGMIHDIDGNILVGDQEGIRKFDGVTGADLGGFATELGSIIDLSYGPNGNLFVSAEVFDAVYEIDAETEEVVGEFAAGGGLVRPNQLLFGGPERDLFVGGDKPDAIFRYDGLTGDFMEIFASGPELNSPSPTLEHPRGTLLVGTGFGNSLVEYEFDGTLVGVFADDGLDFPTFAMVAPICRMTVQVVADGAPLPREISYVVGVQHNKRGTARVPLHLSLRDAAGRVVSEWTTRAHEFRFAEPKWVKGRLPWPKAISEGGRYCLFVSIGGMARVANRTACFDVAIGEDGGTR